MTIAAQNGAELSSASLSGGGDASGAKQDTGNTSLASIDGKLAALKDSRVPVVLTTSGGTAVEPTSNDDSSVYVAGAALTVKRAAVQLSSTGAAVAAVQGKKIRLIFGWLTGADAVNVKWQSASTDLTGLHYLDAAGRGMVLPPNPYGWVETAAGEALNLNLSAGVAVGGVAGYVEVA